ncbi:MAG: hypothetical protein HKN88_02775 [Gammaproteobacteria bacterium]|nr:hypothetical protein [Gammaproteobacteria bacterium]NNC96976.1 hypothetical protein [Gammaproteobacteria bacterium]NNM13421.1 hypothetical protein [Gammaproteobacteria bacterium]
MTSPAEQKEKQRQTKSLVVNLVIATVIIVFAFAATFFEFEALSAKVVFAAGIIAASLLCFILLVRWIRSLDEFEYNLNARACLVAMYSSLFYLPLQYLSEIGVLPEIHVVFLFMGIWIVYLIAIFYYQFK